MVTTVSEAPVCTRIVIHSMVAVHRVVHKNSPEAMVLEGDRQAYVQWQALVHGIG